MFVRGVPTDWDQKEIVSRFGRVGPLQQVYFVKNAAGLNTGKLILTYEKDSSGEQAIA